MDKNDVIQTLRQTADLLEVTEASSFEVMAYRNAAQSLDEWSGDLSKAIADNTVTEIPAVGKGLGKVISNLVTSDQSDEVDRVRGLVPTELPLLLRVRGLGPKRVRALWQDLGVESPDQLRRAADDGRVQTLRGFGAKTVERILSGLDYLQKPPKPKVSLSPETVTMPQASKSTGTIWAGMSGYSYPEWKGNFYPDDAKPASFLEHYAKCLATVEINNTFYRFPTEKVIQQWLAQTPNHFRFAVKAHRRITHQLRLADAARDTIIEFVERCGQLGERLGCILFQLPPDLRRDDERLSGLLQALPAGPHYALEFRHASWTDDDVRKRVSDQNVAIVSGEDTNASTEPTETADFVYARMRRETYSPTDFENWDIWLQTQHAAERDVFAYFKHDEDGKVPHAVATHWGLTARRSGKLAPSASERRPAKKKSG